MMVDGALFNYGDSWKELDIVFLVNALTFMKTTTTTFRSYLILLKKDYILRICFCFCFCFFVCVNDRSISGSNVNL